MCGLICIYTNIVHAWEYSHAKSMIVEFTVFNGGNVSVICNAVIYASAPKHGPNALRTGEL